MIVVEVSLLALGLLDTKLPVAHPETNMAQVMINKNFFMKLDFVLLLKNGLFY